MAVERLIGIDFGTSTSVVKCKRYKDGEPIGDAHHTDSVTFGQGVSDPKALTLVRINEDGTIDCGTDEEIPGARIYRDFKMSLESENEEERERARELTHEYMRYLYKRYSHQENDLGEKDDEVQTIVSFPAKWKEETRNFMALAVSDAGFKNVSSIDEPSAALYAVMARQMSLIKAKELIVKDRDNLILVIDMGAGTTDLAVCKCTVNAESYAVKASEINNDIILSWPDNSINVTFGGREIDQKIKEYLVTYLESCNIPKDIAKNFLDQSSSIKSWKEGTVSPTLGRGEAVRNCSVISQLMSFLPNVKREPFPEITKEVFEKLIEDKIEDYKTLVKGCLDKLEENSEIDVVILTGGHSGWYFAKELIDGTMPGLEHPALKKVQEEKKRVFSLSNPQETVALGMVYSKLPFKIMKNKRIVELKDETTVIRTRLIGHAEENNGELLSVLTSTFGENESSPNLENLKKNMKIDDKETVFYAKECSSSSEGKSGTIITEKGIYATDKEGEYIVYTNWDNFTSWTIDENAKHLIGIKKGKHGKILFCEYDESFLKTLEALQKELIEVRAKNTNNSFNIEKSEPKSPEMCNSLQKAAEAYLKTNEFVSLSLSKGNLTGLRRNLNVPFDDTAYCYKDTTFFGSGKNGYVFTENGFYYCDLWANPNYISWHEFRESLTIWPDAKKKNIDFAFGIGKSYRIVTYDNFQGNLDFFVGLQEVLKNTAVNEADTEKEKPGLPDKSNTGLSMEPAEQISSEEYKPMQKRANTYLEVNRVTAEMISSGNLANLKRFLNVPSEEKVHYYKDTTLFGTGKNGCVVTDKGFYYCETWGVAQFNNWYKFRDAIKIIFSPGKKYIDFIFRDGKSYRLYISGSVKETAEFFLGLQKVLKQ